MKKILSTCELWIEETDKGEIRVGITNSLGTTSRVITRTQHIGLRQDPGFARMVADRLISEMTAEYRLAEDHAEPTLAAELERRARA